MLMNAAEGGESWEYRLSRIVPPFTHIVGHGFVMPMSHSRDVTRPLMLRRSGLMRLCVQSHPLPPSRVQRAWRCYSIGVAA